jgi:uncharacterized membrane-anchored protein
VAAGSGRCDRARDRVGFGPNALRVALRPARRRSKRPLRRWRLAGQARQRDGRTRLGTDAWYFQEGDGTELGKARYGEFRVDDRGTMVLVRMLDEQFRMLGRAR